MKYRLDSDHYINNMLLPAGTLVGDDTPYPYRHEKNTPSKDKAGRPIVLLAGSPLPPSLNMSPMDGESEQLYRAHFGEDAPPRDPTASIPLQGTGDKVKAPGPAAVRPSAVAPTAPPKPAEAPKTGALAPPPSK